MPQHFGATPEEWAQFDLVLGLTADLLPVVGNPTATISATSGMKGLGKTPSRYNGSRHAVGFAQWTQHHATQQEVERWSGEPDYSISLQTREVRGLDVDVVDSTEAGAIREFISGFFDLPARTRSNSAKFLLGFTLLGTFGKRRFKTQHGVVEFLANGQQFIACGTHTSGVRYEWQGGLPDAFPVLSEQQFEDLWRGLVSQFGVEDSVESDASSKADKLKESISTDPVAQHLLSAGIVKKTERDGRLHIMCPWEDEHTAASDDSATTYWPAHTGGYINGHFKCMHAHCEHRTDSDFLNAVGYVDEALMDAFEALSDDAPVSDEFITRFPVLALDAFKQRKSPTWLIKGVLPKGELAVVYGDSGSGKTFMVLDMCIAIAKGEEWRGKRVKQGRVVYVCAEGAGGFRNRIQARNEEAIGGFGVIAGAPNLMEKADSIELAKSIIHSGGADVVVLDTFAQIMPGANENSGEDVGRVLQHCKGIHRATGALVLLVHHSGKDAARGARGWSGLRAACDAELEVIRAGDVRGMTVTKLKEGEDGAEFGFRLDPVVIGQDEDGEDITSCTVRSLDRGPVVVKGKPGKQADANTALGVLSDRMGLAGILSVADAAAALNLSVRQTQDVVTTLAERGRVVLDDGFIRPA